MRTWAPDDLWELAEPLIPMSRKRRQGGGRRRADDRAVLAAIVYLVQAGCSWWTLPASMFGLSRATTHRRFAQWTDAGLWPRLHQQVLHRLGEAGKIAWARGVVDSIAVRAQKGASKPARTRLIEVNRDPKFTYCAIRRVYLLPR